MTSLDQLTLWIDDLPRPAIEQMAVDEALFRMTQHFGMAFLRFYQFSAPSVTIGYFDDYPEDETRPVVRRMTGGGLVEHGSGKDLTYCLTLPSDSSLAKAQTDDRYRLIHQSVFESLKTRGLSLRFEDSTAKSSGPCFSNPVQWDLLDQQGSKMAGGAQRKSRGSVIHQGSLHVPPAFQLAGNKEGWMGDFGNRIAEETRVPGAFEIELICSKTAKLIQIQYKNDNWNKKR